MKVVIDWQVHRKSDWQYNSASGIRPLSGRSGYEPAAADNSLRFYRRSGNLSGFVAATLNNRLIFHDVVGCTELVERPLRALSILCPVLHLYTKLWHFTKLIWPPSDILDLLGEVVAHGTTHEDAFMMAEISS